MIIHLDQYWKIERTDVNFLVTNLESDFTYNAITKIRNSRKRTKCVYWSVNGVGTIDGKLISSIVPSYLHEFIRCQKLFPKN